MESIYHITADDIRSGKLTVSEILSPVGELLDLRAGYMSYIADVSLLTAEQICAFAAWRYCEDVKAGGHDKFLLEPDGMLWREAILGLDGIGASGAAENLRNVRGKFTPDLSFDLAERTRQIEEQNLNFDEEDEIFAKEQGKVEALLWDYIIANADMIAIEY